MIVVVTDDIVTPAFSCTIARLDVGAVDTSCALAYTVTQDDVDAGEITNAATATGSPPSGPPTDAEDEITTPGPTPAPALEVTKLATVGGTTLGSIISYTLNVENTGNVTLTAPSVSDDMSRLNGTNTALDAPFAYVSGDTDTDDLVDVGEVWVYTAQHEITQADINAGGIENSATATANDPTGTPVSDVSDNGNDGDGNTTDDPTTTEITAGPALDVVKVLTSADFTPGGEVAFTITGRNIGNVTLTTADVSDTLTRADGTAPTGTISGPTLTSGNAAGIHPGEEWIWSYVYTLEQADIDAGGLRNSATVTGTPPTGTPVTDVSDNGDDGDGNTTDDETEALIPPNPELEVIKSVITTGDAAGEQVVFDVVVTNSGNVTLSDLDASAIDDTMTQSGRHRADARQHRHYRWRGRRRVAGGRRNDLPDHLHPNPSRYR